MSDIITEFTGLFTHLKQEFPTLVMELHSTLGGNFVARIKFRRDDYAAEENRGVVVAIGEDGSLESAAQRAYDSLVQPFRKGESVRAGATSFTLARLVCRCSHLGQLRRDKLTPYSHHPERVANALAVTMPNSGTDLLAVALLHDVIEDTDRTIEDLKLIGFPQTVIDAVDAITKQKGELYVDYIKRLKGNELARLVKIADILDNLREPLCTEEQRTRYCTALATLTLF